MTPAETYRRRYSRDGFRDGKSIRNPGYWELSWARLGFALEFSFQGREDGSSGWPWMLHVHLLWVNVFVHLPGPAVYSEPEFGDEPCWGFNCSDGGVHIHWGRPDPESHAYVDGKPQGKKRFAIVDYPWLPVHQRHEVRRTDGSWIPYVGSWEERMELKDGTIRDGKEPDGREEFTFPYHYLLKNWTVQERTATVHVERRFWRPKWFQWTSLFERCSQSIDVRFSDEVGERTGSWKGGCIGSGYDMRPEETPEQTLRRMERERKFQ